MRRLYIPPKPWGYVEPCQPGKHADNCVCDEEYDRWVDTQEN